jgi:agmatinase
MIARTDPVPIGRPSFLDAVRCDDLDSLDADLAVVGVPYTTPSDLARSRAACSAAPGVLREQSLTLAGSLRHHDFEFGGELFAGRRIRIVDCGDVAMAPGRFEANNLAVTEVVRRILEPGAWPVILGGDRAAAIPVLRAFVERGSICCVRIAAELDWRDEVDGVRESAPSAMRRVAELPWVDSMVQVGLRGVGGDRQGEVHDARVFGSVLVRAEEVHEGGVEAILGRIPAGEQYFVSLDAGGLDPSIAPGVEDVAFGGLSYFEVTNLLRGIAAKGNVVGLDFTGVAPARDTNDMTSQLGVRLILNLLGALAHNGQIGR